jgi:methylmalonyl-CoA mutase cobalamin-binding subunit
MVQRILITMNDEYLKNAMTKKVHVVLVSTVRDAFTALFLEQPYDSSNNYPC